ncbi:mediator of RNA polymerase II transcription subunit 18 [Aspergillus multicolor]|uniref:mediator of RNA polymerase II transcription subunit 18 n=1 Tax=Aspergillus multicolor TaxID=41759 RepID=UPI003CCCEBDC
MHELLLFASVPSYQHHELLQQLTGLTAMQPRHSLERRLIFKATRKPGLAHTRGGASQGADIIRLNKMLNGQMFYTQVVGPLSEANFDGKPSSSESQDASMFGTDEATGSSYDYDSQPWKLEFRDIPEAGIRSTITARLAASAALPKGDVVPSMNAWGYSFVTEYVVEGDVFIHNDIVIFLHRVLQYPVHPGQEPHEPRRQLPSFRDLSPLERTGSYILQAAITVQDGSNQELMRTASQHLFGLREQLKSAVRLEHADRLSLDTRAK